MLEPVTNTGSRLTVVFDGRGGRSSIQKFGSSNLLDVVYSSSQEGADGVIERMVMASKYPAQICVVTNDNLIRNCAFSCGASSRMRVDQLIKKLEYSIDQITRQVEQRKGKKIIGRNPFTISSIFPNCESWKYIENRSGCGGGSWFLRFG